VAEDRDAIVARLAVERGHLTPAQIAEARRVQEMALSELGIEHELAQVLVSKGMLAADVAQGLARAASVKTGHARRIGGYELKAKIGAGGMGAVFEAVDLRARRRVALKVLPPSVATPEAIARFQRESEMASRLNHPNIVKFVEFGRDEEKGVWFCALEMVDGVDLDAYLKRHGRLSETETVRIALQIAKALRHADQNGLVHRDVKPGNIMITPDGGAKLLDLGLARRTDVNATRYTETGRFVGSPFYASPEQATGEAVIDARSDIYSLGATMYHMVTGSPPFGGTTVAQVLYQQVHGRPRWPGDVNRDLSDDICQVIAKMMAKDPRDRYREPNKLIADLDLLDAGWEVEIEQDVLARSIIEDSKFPRAVRRRLKPRSASADRSTGLRHRRVGSTARYRPVQEKPASRGRAPLVIGFLLAALASAGLVLIAGGGLDKLGAAKGSASVATKGGRRASVAHGDGASGPAVPEPGQASTNGARTSDASSLRQSPTEATRSQDGEWQTICDGTSLKFMDGWSRGAWKVQDGAIIADLGSRPTGVMSVPREVGDAEVVFRFTMKRPLTKTSLLFLFRFVDKPPGRYEVAFDGARARSLGDATHELRVLARGPVVTALLDGREVTVRSRGSPHEGRIQLCYSPHGAEGFTIHSIKYRRLAPAPPDAAPVVRVAGTPEPEAPPASQPTHLTTWTPPDALPGTGAEPDAEPDEPVDLTRGLLAHWTFDEGGGRIAFDSSSFKHDAKLVGDAAWDRGKLGGGVRCSGGNGYVIAPKSGLLAHSHEGDYTLSLWTLGGPSSGGTAYVFVKQGNHTGIRIVSSLRTSSEIWNATTCIVVADPESWSDVSPDRFVHRVLVIDRTNGEVLAYTNGHRSRPRGITPDFGARDYRDGQWRIGWQGFTGIVDDARLYDRALTEEEVLELYREPERLEAGRREKELRERAAARHDLFCDHYSTLVLAQRYGEASKYAEAEAARLPEPGFVALASSAARVAALLGRTPGARVRGAKTLIGREVSLRLVNAPLEGTVEAAGDDGLRVIKIYMINNQPQKKNLQVTWDQLHPEQLDEFARLGGLEADAPDLAVARAYTALRRGDVEAAEGYVRGAADHPLFRHLAARLGAIEDDVAYKIAMREARHFATRFRWKEAAGKSREALAIKPGDADAKALLAKARRNIVPDEAITLELARGVTLPCVYVKSGVFEMGSDEDPPDGWCGVQRPTHEVVVTTGFYFGTCEVTRGQFAAFVAATGHVTDAEHGAVVVAPQSDGTCRDVPGASWRMPTAFVQDDTHPVVAVSWADAKAFCAWASRKTGRDVRLPSEAEWEFACRAGSDDRWHFGDDERSLGEYAWYYDNARRTTHPVGRKKPNAWGLYDMYGNATEWVADWYDAGYYADSPRKDPTGPERGTCRIARGGGCLLPATSCCSAARCSRAPTTCSVGRGFRVAVSVE